MAGIKIDPEMLDIYMESLNKLMAGSETDGGNARLEVSGAGKTEDGLVRYNEEVNKLGDDLRELYGNVGEILGRIRDGTLFKNADKVSVVARSTDGAGVLAKHADEAAAWQHGGKVFRYSDETAEAVASGEKLLKESGTIYESFADMMSPEDAKRYLDFLENGSREGLTGAELAGVEKADGNKDFSIPGPGAYTVKAGDTTYFSLGTEWDKITDTYGLDVAGQNMFDYFNKPALDDAINAGKEIRFSHNPEAYGECALKWEWDYLQEKHGYFALEKRRFLVCNKIILMILESIRVKKYLVIKLEV